MSKRKVHEEDRMSLWRAMKGGMDLARYFSICVVSSKKPCNSSGFAGFMKINAGPFLQNKTEST